MRGASQTATVIGRAPRRVVSIGSLGRASETGQFAGRALSGRLLESIGYARKERFGERPFPPAAERSKRINLSRAREKGNQSVMLTKLPPIAAKCAIGVCDGLSARADAVSRTTLGKRC